MARTISEYKKEIEELKQEILEIFSISYQGHDTKRIEKAMDYAELLHRGQLRKNNVPYIFHPLLVAKHVAMAELDESAIISALLHDTIEDTVASKNSITKQFNSHIADIVQAMTKIRTVSNVRSLEQSKNLTFQRIFKATSKDVRPLLVKIFDRLANMQDMAHMPEGHRLRVSKETFDIYVPLARRLGMRDVVKELSCLSLLYMYPKEYAVIEEKISSKHDKWEADVKTTIDLISQHLEKQKIKAKIQVDWPDVDDFYMLEYGLNPNLEVEPNLLLLVNDIIKIYTSLGVLHSLYTPQPEAVRDMIASPKANGFRALETKMVVRGKIHLFSIMTEEMNDVNHMGIIHKWRVNQTRLSGYYTGYMSLLEQMLSSNEDIRVDEVLNQSQVDGIAVFSPRKDLYVLPHNSCVLDFAYEVHHQIGQHTKGAIVNGIERDIDYCLSTGDIVNVITDKNVNPEERWNKIAVTSKALTSIRNSIKRKRDFRAIELGKEIFFNELEKFGRDPKVLMDSYDFRKTLAEKKISLDTLYRQIGYKKQSALDFIKQYKIVPADIIENRFSAERASIRKKLFATLSRKQGEKWHFGKDDVFIRYAKCCNPIYGDKVVGVVTEGKGVKVHRSNCEKLKGKKRGDLVEVEWDMEDNLTSAVLNLNVSDEQGIFAKVLITVKKYGINMSEFSAYTVGGEAFMKIRLDVKNQRELIKVVNEIRKIDAVKSITRE